MRFYYFFTKFRRSFRVGFRVGLYTVSGIAAVLFTLYLLAFAE